MSLPPGGLAGMWARHLAAPLPRVWLGPFDGRLARVARPVERVVLAGQPDRPVLRHWRDGRWRTRGLDALELVEERSRALGLPATGFVAYEYGHLLEEFAPAPGLSPWPLLSFLFGAEREEAPLPESAPDRWPAAPEAPPSPLEPVHDPAWFRARVRRVKAWIRAGDCYQVNVVQPFQARWPAARAAGLFARLRRADHPGGGYRVLFEERGRALVSDSPELFLRRRGPWLEARPIKGTQAIGPAGTAAARAALAASAKDRAELAMIVDLLRNDLSRICEPGSVEAGEFPLFTQLPTLVHSHAEVRGRPRPGRGWADAIRAAFPCGSISGCPRPRAMRRIAQLEEEPRGPAFGALGELHPDGDFTFSVAIRTASLVGSRLRLSAGGGITIDSIPTLEEEESRAKVELFRRALSDSRHAPWQTEHPNNVR